MPAKQTSRFSAVIATVFTSLIAPTVVSLVTKSIKAEDPSRALANPPPPITRAIIDWPPPAPTVVLLPPRATHSLSPVQRASFLEAP
jgi:hypothetical protein